MVVHDLTTPTANIALLIGFVAGCFAGFSTGMVFTVWYLHALGWRFVV